jgi:pre-mRNA-processing factor 6
MARFRAENPKLQQQFADLKRGLSAVTDNEWDSIPEVGNLTRRKRQKQERSYVVPDSVLVGDRTKTEYENALDPMQQDVSLSQLLGVSWQLTQLSDRWLGYACGFKCDGQLR